MQTNKTYSAEQLLYLIAEFRLMQSNSNSWNEAGLAHNPPRLYRLQMINSLLKAFNLGSELNWEFLQGYFLHYKNVEDYPKVQEVLEKFLNQNPNRFFSGLKNVNLASIFQILFEVYEKLLNLFSFGKGSLVGGSSLGHVFPKLLVEDLNNKISQIPEYEILLSILKSLISPKDVKFSRQELITNYQFPDVDLLEVDMEHF